MKLLFFFGFLVSSNTRCLQTTKKPIFELLTAFNIIHFIYNIVHNIYLTSIALKTTSRTIRQPTISKQKGVAKKMVCSLFLAFPPWLGLQTFFHPCNFGATLKQSTHYESEQTLDPVSGREKSILM